MADVNKAQALGFRSRPLKRVPGVLPEPEKIPASVPGNGSARENQTQRAMLMVAGAIFLVVSFLHLLRSIFKVRVTIGKFTIPLWASAIGAVILLLLSLWMIRVM